MSEHTPTPWYVDRNERPWIIRCDDYHIAHMTTPAMDEEARLIVHAVNNHERLVSILSRLVGRYENDFCKAQNGHWGNQADAYYMLAKHAQHDWKEARAALAKVEEES